MPRPTCPLSFDHPNREYTGSFNMSEGDSIGHCEKKRSYEHMSVSE